MKKVYGIKFAVIEVKGQAKGEKMNKLGIILASHGDFAKGALNCIETITGQVDNTAVLSVTASSNVEDIANQMKKAYQCLIQNNEEVFIFVDILSGTPSNVATRLLLTEKNITVFAGFNIPILLEVFTRRLDPSCKIDDLTDELKHIFASSLTVLNGDWKEGI